MNSADSTADYSGLLVQVAALLDDLGPFDEKARREEKWRTTDQLAIELELFGWEATDRLDRVLRDHEKQCVERLQRREPLEALVRRAKYPDRTTALLLWGGVKWHGQPWVGHQRTDPPEDLPATLRVSDSAPHVL